MHKIYTIIHAWYKKHAVTEIKFHPTLKGTEDNTNQSICAYIQVSVQIPKEAIPILK